MLTVGNIRSGQREYLADTEQKNQEELMREQKAKALDNEQYRKYCKENNLEFTKSTFEKYLNNGQSHYEARVSSGIKQVFGIEKYSRKDYEKLLSGESPISNPTYKGTKLARNENGNLVKKTEKQRLGVDLVGAAPKSVSILFAIGDREMKDKIANAMFQTAEQQVEELAKQVKPSTDRKLYQDFDPSQTKVFAFHYLHTDARPDEKNKAKASKENIANTIDAHGHTHTHMSNVAVFAFFKRDKNGEIIRKADGTPDYNYKTLSIDSSDLMRRQLENSSQYDTMLNSNLQKAGIKTEAMELKDTDKGTIHDSFRVVGITREMELACSSRSQKYHENNKNQSVKERLKTFKNTKSSKLEFTASELENIIKNNTVDAIGVDSVGKIMEAQRYGKQEHKEIDTNLKVLKNATLQNTGIYKETEVRKEILKSIQYERQYKDMDDINQAVEKKLKELSDPKISGRDSLVAVLNENKKIVGYTRLSNAMTERAYMEKLDFLSKDTTKRTKEQKESERQFLKNYVEEAKNNGMKFNKGQLTSMAMELRLGYEGGRVLGVNGAPGAGKTSSSIAFAVALNKFRNNGECRVYGISTANTATKALGEAGIDKERLLNSSQVITRAFKKKEDGSYVFNEKFINDPKNQNNLYIFDEYGLQGVEKANLILELAKKTNSQFLYVGDENQLKSVEYGNPMGYANQYFQKNDPKKVVFLDEIMRQKNDRALSIVRHIEKGESEELFNLLKNEKALTITKTEKSLITQVAKDYVADKRDQSKKIIVANTNATIDELNSTIRERLVKENPEIYKNEVNLTVARQGRDIDIERKMKFGEGERIVFLKGMKETDPKTGLPKKDGWSIDNSQLAVIQNIKRSQSGSYDITVKTDGKDITFNTAKDGNYFAQSYCVSVYKSQGSTVDSIRHISTGGNEPKNSIYVSASRHKGTEDKKDEQGNIVKGELGYHLYLAENNVEKFKQNLNQEQAKFSTLENKECDIAVKEYKDIVADRLLNEKSLEPVKTYQVNAYNEEKYAIEAGKELQAQKDMEYKELNANLEFKGKVVDLSNFNQAEVLEIKQKQELKKELELNQPFDKEQLEEFQKSIESIRKEIAEAKEEVKEIRAEEKTENKINLDTKEVFELSALVYNNPDIFEKNTEFFAKHQDKEIITNSYLRHCNEKYTSIHDIEKSVNAVKEVGELTEERVKNEIINGYLSTEDKFMTNYLNKEQLNSIDNKVLEHREGEKNQIEDIAKDDIFKVKEMSKSIIEANKIPHNTKEVESLRELRKDLLNDIVNDGKLNNPDYIKGLGKDIQDKEIINKVYQEINNGNIKYGSKEFGAILEHTDSNHILKIKDICYQQNPNIKDPMHQELNQVYRDKLNNELTRTQEKKLEQGYTFKM